MKRISLILISVAIVLMASTTKASEKNSKIPKFTGKYLIKMKQDLQDSESMSSTAPSSRIPSLSTTPKMPHDIPTFNTITKTESETFGDQSTKTKSLADLGLTIEDENLWENLERKKLFQGLPKDNYFAHDDVEIGKKAMPECCNARYLAIAKKFNLPIANTIRYYTEKDDNQDTMKKILTWVDGDIMIEHDNDNSMRLFPFETEKDDNGNTMKKILSCIKGELMIEHDNDNSMRKILSPQSESCQFPKSWTISYKENGKKQMMGPDLRIWNSSEDITQISDDDSTKTTQISDDESTEAIISSRTSDGNRKK